MPSGPLKIYDGAKSRDLNGLLAIRHSNPTDLSNGRDVALQWPSENSETQNPDSDDNRRNHPGSVTNSDPDATRNRTNKSESIHSYTSNGVGGTVESKTSGIWQYLDDS